MTTATATPDWATWRVVEPVLTMDRRSLREAASGPGSRREHERRLGERLAAALAQRALGRSGSSPAT